MISIFHHHNIPNLPEALKFVESAFSEKAKDFFYRFMKIEGLRISFIRIGFESIKIDLQDSYRLSIYDDGVIFWYRIDPEGYNYLQNFESVFEDMSENHPDIAEVFCFHLDLFR